MTESPQSFRHRATTAIELLKRARTEWVTRPALAKAIGAKPETVNRWVAELVASGVLIGMSDAMRQGTPAKKTKKAETGDQLIIDFVGKLDGVEFDGGKAEDAALEGHRRTAEAGEGERAVDGEGAGSRAVEKAAHKVSKSRAFRKGCCAHMLMSVKVF